MIQGRDQLFNTLETGVRPALFDPYACVVIHVLQALGSSCYKDNIERSMVGQDPSAEAMDLTCRHACVHMLDNATEQQHGNIRFRCTSKAYAEVLQCLLHMPHFGPKFWAFAILSAVRTANSNCIL